MELFALAPVINATDSRGRAVYYGLRKSTSSTNRGTLVPVRISKAQAESTVSAFNQGKVLRAPSPLKSNIHSKLRESLRRHQMRITETAAKSVINHCMKSSGAFITQVINTAKAHGKKTINNEHVRLAKGKAPASKVSGKPYLTHKQKAAHNATAKAKATTVTIDLHPTIVSSPRPTSTSTSSHIDGYKVSKSGKAKRSKKRTSKPY